MANAEHLKILKKGVKAWNQWREKNPKIRPKGELFGAEVELYRFKEMPLPEIVNVLTAYETAPDLSGAILCKADLCSVNFSGTNLSGVDLTGADLWRADLRKANLTDSKLTDARLSSVSLSMAKLRRANLSYSKLQYADLTKADLQEAILVGANLYKAKLTGANVYGVAAWDVDLDGAEQTDLIIVGGEESRITVDNLEIAQFIYLFLHNEKIRSVINTITSKLVLILGRFTEKRKKVLDAIRDAVRKLNYLPVQFDFEKPTGHTYIETVSTLAHMARFVIADFTDPKIVLEEVPHIVRNIAVPVKPLLLEGHEEEPSTLSDLRVNHRSLLDTYRYKDLDDLLSNLVDEVIVPAEERARDCEKS